MRAGPDRGPRAVLALLREDRWRKGLALAVLVAVVCVLLGQWQWHRRAERLARNAPLVQNYDRSPTDLAAVLDEDGSPLAPGEAWTPVRVRGTYDQAGTLLVRNRPRDDTAGYDVLVPLVLDGGARLMVDRGWIPAGSGSERPDSVPAPPGGAVEVVARLRPWEEPRRGAAPTGQVPAVAEQAVRSALQTVSPGPAPLLGGYAVLAAESPGPAGDAPRPEVRPDVDEGPHLAYTVQWYGFALTALVVWVVAGRRELEQRALGAVPAGDGPDPGPAADLTDDDAAADRTAPDGAGPDGRRRREARAPRPRRRDLVRPGSDEEAEDAEAEAARRS
ncbi:SURF1 family protein [Kineococcus gynurae]|uniref:SURF1-like protein n=1 Tax=Kineococcus gynurae TaxID=452979 RepID=A0ABV5LQP7_9ACTN